METFKEFRQRIINSKPHKKKVTNSLGVYDAYKYYRKNKPKEREYILTESLYFAIIRLTNLLLINNLLNNETIELPKKMGAIELRKRSANTRFNKDGKLVSNLAIDWNATLKLWYEDDGARIKKTLIRIEEKELFKIYYNRGYANYINKSYYEFLFNKELKVELKKKIKLGVIDAPLLKKGVKN